MTPNFRVDGKVAVVTGAAGGGIGQRYAKALAEAGASVVIADINCAGAVSSADALVALGYRAIAVTVDITDEQSTRNMAASAVDAFGGIDILVNNAAFMEGIPRTPLADFPMDVWDHIMSVNVAGALRCAQACIPSMKARGGGKIINQSSGGAFMGGRPYAVSKLALVSLTTGLARELGPFRINVNAIAPGFVESDAALRMHSEDSPFRQSFRTAIALPDATSPESLCGTLVFLASPASDAMTGQCLNVDGGWVMRV